MISKQLFISFLFLCSFCVSVYAFKQDILGVGVPPNLVNQLDGFFLLNTDETLPSSTVYIVPPTLEEEPIEEEQSQGVPGNVPTTIQEDGITHSNAGVPAPSYMDDGITQSNVGLPDHLFNAEVARLNLDNHHEDNPDESHDEEQLHTHEEMVHHYMQEASVKLHKAWQSAMQYPKQLVAGATSLVLLKLGCGWWQHYKARACINAVLQKYGKQLSEVSVVHAKLLLAAYNKDQNAMYRSIARYGLEPLEGPENAWVMPALETLCSR